MNWGNNLENMKELFHQLFETDSCGGLSVKCQYQFSQIWLSTNSKRKVDPG